MGELQHVLAATPEQQDLQVRNAVFLPCEVERGEAPAVVANDVEGPAGDDDARSRGARRPIHPTDALEQAVSPVVELVAAEGRAGAAGDGAEVDGLVRVVAPLEERGLDEAEHERGDRDEPQPARLAAEEPLPAAGGEDDEGRVREQQVPDAVVDRRPARHDVGAGEERHEAQGAHAPRGRSIHARRGA